MSDHVEKIAQIRTALLQILKELDVLAEDLCGEAGMQCRHATIRLSHSLSAIERLTALLDAQ